MDLVSAEQRAPVRGGNGPREVPAHLLPLLARWGLELDRLATARLPASRNVTVVCRRHEHRFIVKASRSFDGGVDFEAEALPCLAAALHGTEAGPLLPELFAAQPGALAARWVSGRTLYQHRRRPPGEVDDERIGGTLAALHAASRKAGALPTRSAPGSLVEPLLKTTPELYAELGPATEELWSRVQSDRAAVGSLERLRRAAAARQCFLHGDLRQANLVLSRRGVALLDWELAGWGAPARDLGTLLADELAAAWAPRAPAERCSVVTLRRRAKRLMGGYCRAADRYHLRLHRGFASEVIGWAAEALLRRLFTIGHHAGSWGALDRRLLERALVLLRHPANHVHQLLGAV